MKRVVFALVLLLIRAPVTADQELSPHLEETRLETLHKLELLYGLERQQILDPIHILVANPGELQSDSWRVLPDYAAGAADPATGRIVIIPSRTGRYPFGDEAQTLKHELSHILLYRALGYRPPRWFDEGLAMRSAGEWGLQDELYMALALYSAAKGRYPLERVESDFQKGESQVRRSYALTRAFVRDFFRDDRDLKEFIASARIVGSVDKAFLIRYGLPPEKAFLEWAQERPLWKDWAIAISSTRAIWFVILLLFLVATFYSLLRRRKIYKRLPE